MAAEAARKSQSRRGHRSERFRLARHRSSNRHYPAVLSADVLRGTTLMWELLVDALAVYRLTRLITLDGFPPIRRAREWVLRRWPSEDTELAESEMVEATSITAAGGGGGE